MSENLNLENLTQGINKPPSAVEVEQAVLGAMIIEPEAVPKALEVLKPECFYDKKHRIIFEAMIRLFEANETIDNVSLFEELRKENKLDSAGGAAYLAQLSQNITSAANVDYHARVILEKWILRKLISTSIDIAGRAFRASEDVFDILDAAETEIFQITQSGLKESFKSMKKAVGEVIEQIEAIHSNQKFSFAVPTGYLQLDDMLGGFQKSDLIIIAARPSMGKTAFALSIARNAAVDHNVPIAIFSLEMSTNQLVTRLISAEARINAHSIRTGKFKAQDGSRISRTAYKLKEAPIFIDDTPAQTVLEIRAKARRLKAEKNIGLIIIDYLQLMNSSIRLESREREISHISRSLKALAKELNIPVIALSQLNRAVEQRHDKRPQLSDLRESGSIEQDADVVIFLNRPEFYGITTDSDGNSTEGIAEIIIGKQRNGPIGEIKLFFLKEFAKFENLDTFHADFIPEQISPSQSEDEEEDDVI